MNSRSASTPCATMSATLAPGSTRRDGDASGCPRITARAGRRLGGVCRAIAVHPAIPIVLLDGVDACVAPPLRVLTLGLAPSLHKFPEDQPFRRFPPAAAVTPGEHDRHVDALPSYLPGYRHRGWFSSLEPLFNDLGSSHSASRPPTARAARHLLEGGVELEALVAAEAGLADARQAFAKGPILALQVAGPGHAPPRSEPGCWTPEGVAPPRVARRVAIQVARQQIQAGYTTVSTAPVCL